MTSLIFGGIYAGHKSIIAHRREKQRQKNYERWEDLRDDYDAQRKISRETRSMDIQRTGNSSWGTENVSPGAAPAYGGYNADADRPILTMRDQQEANDARTSWRPQESFDPPPRRSMDARPAYTTQPTATLNPNNNSGSGLAPMKSNKTGATWDEGLPVPLQVSRRSYDNNGNWTPQRDRSTESQRSGSGKGSRTASQRELETQEQQLQLQPQRTSSAAYGTPTPPPPPPPPPASTHVDPIQHQNPGGRMAELLSAKAPGAEEPVEMDEWWKR